MKTDSFTTHQATNTLADAADDTANAPAVFPQMVAAAVRQLKTQLEHDYELAYPQLSEIIHLVVNEEAENARALTAFPHLLLPDLVEAHIANLNLRPAPARRAESAAPRRASEFFNYQLALSVCG